MKILGIGNAIVDVICKVEDNFISSNGLTKGTMKLISEKNFNKTKILVYVSPELHGHRLDQKFISFLTKLNQDFRENSVFICTDVPEIYIKC